MGSDERKRLTSNIFYAALKAVDPYESVKLHVGKINSIYSSGNFNRLFVIGFGKAACPMAKAIGNKLSDLIIAGVIITKYGHCNSRIPPLAKGGEGGFSKIKIIEAGHPIPDENGLKGTFEMINLLKDADEQTLVVCLISGGGSALLVSPYNGITLSDKQNITDLLLKAGANIYEINAVRKHLSKVKGGRLAKLAYPARIISMIFSDVIGDRLDVIASGPTSPDKTTYNNALAVLEKYNLTDKCPQNILNTLQKGNNGLIPETPKKGNKIFENVENIIIGSNKIALDAAKKNAEKMGFYSEILSSELTGEAREVGGWLAQRAKNLKIQGVQDSKCLISGGETTVTVKSNGIGGRNMELALAFAIEIEGIDGITLLSAGTDGTDGPTDAAGAIVDGETVKEAKAIGLDPEKYLGDNDSYNFFKQINGLLVTGPTETNVMDIQIVLVK